MGKAYMFCFGFQPGVDYTDPLSNGVRPPIFEASYNLHLIFKYR